MGWDIADDGCWHWRGTRIAAGYGVFTIAPHAAVGAHRFAVWLSTGRMPRPSDHVAHSCDNPQCVNPDHLTAGTCKANMQDMAAKGRSTHGEKSPHAKLTIDQVVEMLARSRQGESSYSMAADYPVSARYIRSIVKGERWQTALRMAGQS
ncbi:hypothetical protein B0T42_07320 [Rathayibacter sp. VKM Ac-2630]|nr:hypothetical protein B0T42_07320 [Rathayibacter sp. VKM Ac-2630]